MDMKLVLAALAALALAPAAAAVALPPEAEAPAVAAPAPAPPSPPDLPALERADAGVSVDAQGGAGVDAPPVGTDLAPPVDPPLGLGVEADADADASVGLDVGLAGAPDGGEPLDRGVLDALPPEVADAAPPVLATAGLLAVLQAFGGLRALGVGGVALYSRLARSELLDNEHRDRVYRMVQETPGVALSEIAKATGLGWGTTVYHVDRLERGKFITTERSGLHRCCFPVGAVPREARKGLGALKGDTTRTVAAFVLERPGATQTELCDALKMSASAASKQISKLEGAGLLRRERDWKTVHLFPQPALGGLLAGDGPAGAPAAPLPAAPALSPLAA